MDLCPKTACTLPQTTTREACSDYRPAFAARAPIVRHQPLKQKQKKYILSTYSWTLSTAGIDRTRGMAGRCSTRRTP